MGIAGLAAPRIFTSAEEIQQLDIIDFARTNGYWDTPGAALAAIADLLIDRAAYLVTDMNLYDAPARDDWPGWEHGWNEATAERHQTLGRLLWNYWHWIFPSLMPSEALQFSDAPDLSGLLPTGADGGLIAMQGDIGHVSASTFMLTVRGMRAGKDMWVSVPDAYQLVYIEPLIDYPALIAETFGLHAPETLEIPARKAAYAQMALPHV